MALGTYRQLLGGFPLRTVLMCVGPGRFYGRQNTCCYNRIFVHLVAMKMNIFNNVQIPYSGFSIASRALLMHIIVRVVRTVSFLAVVLPNARTPTCYARRFPPVPETMLDFIWTGLSTLKGFGGCNDLILRHEPLVCLHQGSV